MVLSVTREPKDWFVGDSVNPRDPDLVLTKDGENFRLNGTKNFSTGAKGSDIIIIAATRDDLGNVLFAPVPRNREGVLWKHWIIEHD